MNKIEEQFIYNFELFRFELIVTLTFTRTINKKIRHARSRTKTMDLHPFRVANSMNLFLGIRSKTVYIMASNECRTKTVYVEVCQFVLRVYDYHISFAILKYILYP